MYYSLTPPMPGEYCIGVFRRFNGLKWYTKDILTLLDDDISQFSSLPDFTYRRNLVRAGISEMCEDPTQSFSLNEELPIECLQLYTEWSLNGSEANGIAETNQSADALTTGEALYINDMKVKDVVYGGVVLSTVAHGKILKIDTSDALRMNGVLGYYDINVRTLLFGC
ncbi:aldehyde oxidase and xanthine dehydrogenase, a/b hammerhead domain protein [Cooperia oncophora]